MALSPRVSRNECHITGYNVVIEAGDEADTVKLTLVDTCNSLSGACRAKTILIKAYKDYLADNGASTDVLANCKYASMCPQGGPNMTYYHYDYVLEVAESSVLPPTEELTVFVDLPLDCTDNVVTGEEYEVSTTTTA